MPIEDLKKVAKNYNGLIVMHDDIIDGVFIKENNHLKVISVYGLSFDNVDLKEATK